MNFGTDWLRLRSWYMIDQAGFSCAYLATPRQMPRPHRYSELTVPEGNLILDRSRPTLPIFFTQWKRYLHPPRTMLKQNFRGRNLLLFSLGLMTVLGLAPARAQQKTNISDQLYIEVSALGSLDYFYDHKLGLQKAGEAMGVKTEYVGPAEYDISAMVTAFEQAIARKPSGIIVVGFESSLNAIVDKA